ncbi:hypothetical protein JVT61DRAFT_12650 [Boletus reticuloceps]|uniref:Secreted protein n=1 Tax=Boletus reticuloceps TaxID=495285 RepID=A0A8I2YLR8_9AGAM|nr:hypothetical protein JVT61DRAFT_3885 [Boletus reticuloceps]KAG6378395.1 hypothetical protein JVT61DRAFT_12650 [Boletus reticuloceps]
MFGSLFRLAVDALLFSAFLAGIKRTTGLTYVLCRQPSLNPTHNVLDLRYLRYLTRTSAVSGIVASPALSDQVTELLRTYLEFGAFRLSHPRPWLPNTRSRRVCL